MKTNDRREKSKVSMIIARGTNLEIKMKKLSSEIEKQRSLII